MDLNIPTYYNIRKIFEINW